MDHTSQDLQFVKDVLNEGLDKLEFILCGLEIKKPEELTECGLLPNIKVLNLMDRLLERLSEGLHPDEFLPLGARAAELFGRMAVVAKNHIIVKHGELPGAC